MAADKHLTHKETVRLRDFQRSRRWMLVLLFSFVPTTILFYFITRSDSATFWFALVYGFTFLFVGGLHSISRFLYMGEKRKKSVLGSEGTGNS